MNRIALIEDHERVANIVCRAFANTGIEVEVYDRIATARVALRQLSYSTIIVDRGLPDGDGLEFVRELRSRGTMTPCLLLTARDAVNDRIAGLDGGADDYLTKPFSTQELVARVRALLRRPAALHAADPEYRGLKIVAAATTMEFGDDAITLAPAELQIMLTLVRRDAPLAQEALRHRVQGRDRQLARARLRAAGRACAIAFPHPFC